MVETGLPPLLPELVFGELLEHALDVLVPEAVGEPRHPRASTLA
jgi:hypothetical protein